jgi:hypothetical protein
MRRRAVLAAAALLLTGCSRTPAPQPTRSPLAPGDRLTQAREITRSLARVVRARDRSAFGALVSDRDATFAGRARLLYDNLSTLPLAELSFTPEPGDQEPSAERRAVLGAEAWVQPVVVTWRLATEDGAAQHRVWFTFVPASGGARWAGTLDGPPVAPPMQQPSWWLGPVSVQQRGRVTVVTGSGQPVDRWLRLTRVAAADVRADLPAGVAAGWPGTVVVEVPATGADFAAVLGQSADRYTGIAAVAHQAGDGDRAPLRVVVNHRAGDLVTADQLSEILRHEIVHVATRSPESPAPLWAVEGLAEWVALRARPGGESFGTAELLAAVRRDGTPRTFPADDAFRVGGPDLNRAYASAWLACRYVAETYSVPRLGRLYAQLDAGRTLDQAAAAALGVRAAELTAGWRDDLARRAGTR